MTAIELRPEGMQTARLFETHGPRLLGYCVRRLGSRTEAEDAVQTVFLYAHRALRRGVVPNSEEAWLLAIAKNVCRWQQRTASRRSTVGGLDPDAIPSHVDESETEDIHRDLEEALTSVPERQRQALLLREWRGLSCPEIAEVLELSPPATHALLTRARRTVASALTAAGRRPVLGLDLPSLLPQLRGLFAGTTAKAAATAVAVAGLGAGGFALEHEISPGNARSHPVAPAATALNRAASAPVSALPSGAAVMKSKTASARTVRKAGAASFESVSPPGQTGTSTVPVSTLPTITDALPPKSGDGPTTTSPNATTPESSQPASPIDLPRPPSPDPGSIVALPTVPVPQVPDPTLPSVEVPTVSVPSVDVPTVSVPAPSLPPVDPLTEPLP